MLSQPTCILVLIAVVAEAKAVAKGLTLPCPRPGYPSSGLRSGIWVEIHLIGIRGKGLDDCCLKSRPMAVIMAGLAGALDPALRIGDVLVEGVPGGIEVPAGCRSAVIHTTSTIVSTPQQKAGLRRQTGAAAVEMENACVADWVRGQWGADVPLILVRAISDRADQMLDPALLSIVDSYGRPKILRLFRSLLLRPQLIPHLIRLGAHSKRAARRLSEAVREIVESIAAQQDRAAANGHSAGASQSQSSSSSRPSV